MSRRVKGQLEEYTPEQAKIIEKFIDEHFGVADNILEEKKPERIKLKFNIIPPSMKNHCYTVVTTGMGAHVMTAELLDGSKLKSRAELIISLPADWDVENFEPENNWPFRLLEIIAKMPVEDNAFIFWGHTVQFNSNFADNVGFSGAVLKESAYGEESCECSLGEDGSVHFFQVLPLYKREVEYKNKRSTDALFSALSGVSHIVDIDRECAVPENYEDIIDTAADHSSKIEDKELDIPEINGANHIAAYLRWSIEHDMLDPELADFFAEELDDIKAGRLDVRTFVMTTLGGELNKELFNDEGKAFTDFYYDFFGDGDYSYPGDVDAAALAYFGKERYNCEEFQDEAYLFVPYDEAYYKTMCKYINKAYKAFMRKSG